MSKSSQIEYSECMTLVTMVVTIYMCEYWKIYTQIQKHVLSCSCHFPFISVHIPFMRFYFPVSFLSLPSMFLPFPSIISLFHVHLIEIALLSFCFCFLMSFWCSSNFPFRSSHFPPFILLSCHFSFLPFSFKSCRVPCMSYHFCDLGHHGGHNLYVWILRKTQIQKHVLSCSCHFLFISVHIPFMRLYFPVSFLSLPSMFLPYSSIISLFYVHLIQCSSFSSVPSCPSDVPLISLSVRLIFLLIFLSCPFHFTLLSLQFPSLFPSSHAVFLVCPVILGRKIKFPRIFVPNYVHGPWFFSWSSMPVYAFLQFFTSSNVLLSSFRFTLLYFNAFHFLPLSCHVRYFHVLPLSALIHILSLSLHAMSKSSQIEYSECMTLVTMVVTIYVWEYWKYIYTDTKTFPVVFVPFPFHSCSHSFHAFLFSCQFSFTSFHVPSIFINHIFVLRSSYLMFLLSFCSFMSFWCSSDFPFRSSHFPPHLSFMSLSFYSLVTSVSFPFSFKSCRVPCMSCHFRKKNRISAHVRFIFFS